ncbi:MAG: AbrB/MazE/SpoVT family DNA-binding domain-containing protein [Lachnospirales bacterium]
MKSTGIVRKIDALGRMVLPSELRANFNLKEGDALEIFTSNDMIVLKKYTPADIFTGEMDNLIEYRGKKVSVNTIKELARIAGLKINDNENILEDDFEIDDPM